MGVDFPRPGPHLSPTLSRWGRSRDGRTRRPLRGIPVPGVSKGPASRPHPRGLQPTTPVYRRAVPTPRPPN